MLTATQAAQVLGVSKRTIYTLAAKGLLPCYRIGSVIRFEQADLDAYKASCRSASTPAINAGDFSSIARQAAGESALLNYFREAGIAPRPRNSTGAKRPGCTHLRLASQNLST